jgi:broad specificity phosphatase PhoE
LTSATPFDPPLSYGGWLQARSLGNRIASILRVREVAGENQSDTPANSSHAAPPTDDASEQSRSSRKHKIIIHSSPFIRCIQTAVAISAGIGQLRKATVTETHRSRPVLHSGLPLVRASNDSPQLTAIPEPEHLHISPLNHGNPSPEKNRIAQLRIDAFLGEWLSPDYFENMTPPPSSILMVASAKAELLRPVPETANTSASRKSSLGHFPGGWSRDRSPASSADEEEKTGLANMAALSHSLPRRLHNVSHGNGTRTSVRHESHDTPPAVLDADYEHLTYVPPTPTYAVSNSDPIPAGYVAHAQNACVDVIYQWDSIRPPQDWGNGGEYGEEWSNMHKRFRNGLQRMIAWYEKHGTSVSPTDRTLENDEDANSDIVLILVTHGAGCNALIGALTNQPVLLDVGMASLTMAVRKSEGGDASPTLSQSPKKARRGSIDVGISAEYTMELTASTEHLRAASHSLGMAFPRLDGPFFGANRPSSGSPFLDVPDSSSLRSGFAGGLHRSASGSQGLRPYPMTSRSRLSSGLWGSDTASAHGGVSESSDSDSMPNFDGTTELHKSHEGSIEATSRDETTSKTSSPSIAATVQRGLWAGNFVNSPKRRWTSADH